MTRDAELPRSVVLDYDDAPISASDRAMLDYARALTHAPGEMTARDIERLREAGFDDRGIHDITQIVAYFNFVNRMADGLGVELEPTWDAEMMVVTRDEFERSRG